MKSEVFLGIMSQRKLVTEKILLFLPSLLAGLLNFLGKKKSRRLSKSGKTVIIFPKDEVLAYLGKSFLDWWVEVFHLPVTTVNLAKENHPAIEKELFLKTNPLYNLWQFIKNRFHTVVFLEPQRYRFMTFLCWLAGIPYRVGFTLKDQNPFLNYRYDFHEGSTHYIHQLRSFFEEITGHKANVLPLLEKKPKEEALRKALKLITELGVGRFVAFLAGPLWPKELYAELASMLPITVLLLGLDEASYKRNEGILKLAKEGFFAKNEIYLIPELDKDLLRALCSRSEVVITEDSLAAHYALSFGSRVITLFGPRNEKVFSPFSNRSTPIFIDIPCRPCFKIQEEFFCTNQDLFACMKLISPQMVLQKWDEISRKAKPISQTKMSS